MCIVGMCLVSQVTSYAADGDLDTTFDTDGKVTTDFGSTDNGYAVAMQSSGKIVVAGYTYNGTNYDFVM